MPDQTSSTTLTIDQLCLSPFNVRTNQQDATATSALEASILLRGLILPLVVHPMRGARRKGHELWGVYAGGRRYRSIKALVDRGDLPQDWPVDVVIRDLPDAELIAVSAAENMLRRELRPYETYAAVAKAHRKGDSAAKIAETIGQEINWVRQALRLGNLARPIFEALEAEAIGVDQARAYAATEDQVLQMRAFQELDPLEPWQKTPDHIRRWLRVGDGQAARLLRFVGADDYADAGGRIELDLFADGVEERGRIIDEDILRRLADDRLAVVRDATRMRLQRPDLRFVAEPPASGYGGHDYTLQVTPKVIDPETAALPDGDVVAYIRIAESGEPDLTYWWASRAAKHGNKSARDSGRAANAAAAATLRPGAAIGGQHFAYQPVADAAIKAEAGLTRDGIDIFRSVRQMMMRAALVQNADAGDAVAIDYLIWSQLRLKLKNDYSHQLGVAHLGSPDRGTDNARDHVAATEASRIWSDALYELQHQTFFTGEDLVEAYLDYRATGPRLKRIAAAVVTGLAIERSLNADGYRLPVHDALAADLGLLEEEALRALWRPTEAMLQLLGKDECLGIAEPFVESVSLGPWQRLKAKELVPLVLAAVTGASNVVRASMADAAARWVHPLLRFAATGVDDPLPETADNDEHALEAAE